MVQTDCDTTSCIHKNFANRHHLQLYDRLYVIALARYETHKLARENKNLRAAVLNKIF